MYNYGKRIIGLALFVVVVSVIFPLWSPSQTPERYEFTPMERQVAAVGHLETDVAVLKEQLTDITRRQVETQQAIEGMQTKVLIGLLGILVAVVKMILGSFGARFGLGRDERNKMPSIISGP